MAHNDKCALVQPDAPSDRRALKGKKLPTARAYHTEEAPSSLDTDNIRAVLLPCELPQEINGLGINLSIIVPTDKPHGYITYQNDTSPPNLPALAALFECVLIQLANAD